MLFVIFPKGTIDKIRYLRQDELVNCDQRVSKIETYSGPLYVLKTAVPSLRSNVTAIYLSYDTAASNEDEEETVFYSDS